MAQDTLLQIATIVLLLPLLNFIFLIFFGKRLGDKISSVTGTSVLGIGLILSIIIFIGKVFIHQPETVAKPVLERFEWFSLGTLSIQVGIGVDNLTAIMLVVVTMISFLVHLFSTEYMHGDKRFTRYYAYLSLFTFSMLGIVIANNFLFMYVFWELVGLSSYLLIGFWYEKKSASDAGKKAFLTNRVGDFGFFAGIMILFFTYQSFMFEDIFAKIGMGILPFDSGTMMTVAGILIFCGAIGKSAQFPLHVWLPDAMEGPTPVSALIHAATMVAAGVYMTARVFQMMTGDALTFIAYIGAITAFMAATIALTQNDFKKVLAYSTVSQLGYMVMGLGVGAFTSGFMHLVTHAWFKGALFLSAGSVIHAMHHSMHKAHNHSMDPQDINNMGGLRKTMPWTYGAFLLLTMAIAGVPFLSGFLSKDGILAGTFAFGVLTGHWLIPIMGFGAAAMTAFYMFRLLIISFHGKPKTDIAAKTHENKFVVVFPLILLSVLTLWFVYSPNPFNAGAGWFHSAVKTPENVIPAELQWNHLLPLEEAHHTQAAGVHSHGHGEAAQGHEAVHEESHHAEAEEAHGGHHAATLFEEELHNAHYPAMGLSIFLAAMGILIAFAIYQFKVANPDNIAKQIMPLYKFSLNKWYIDEMYHYSFIGGTILISKFMALFDNKVIDGLVNFAATIARFIGWVSGKFDGLVIDGIVNLLANIVGFFGAAFRKFQTGKVQTYVIMVIVVIMVLVLWVF